MARNVFISFRFQDGVHYKNKLSELFSGSSDVINYSEDEDRTFQTEETIQKYLYQKLKNTSVTVILITPAAINHNRTLNKYDDWMYDEIRYSLEDRENNRCNGIVAVYTKEAKDMLISRNIHECEVCSQQSEVVTISSVDNLFRKNMMNIKDEYKNNKCPNVYDRVTDSYCSLVSWDEFIDDFAYHIENAYKKRGECYKYELVKRLY